MKGTTHFPGTSWSSMRPLMKLAISTEDCLISDASLETVSFWKSSSSTLIDWAFSEGILSWY